MPQNNHSFSLRMRPLPKAEYQLMKMMIARYSLDGPSELFTALLRLSYEVLHRDDIDGHQWLIQIIDTLRSLPDEERRYELHK